MPAREQAARRLEGRDLALNQAMKLKPEYFEAMIYINLLDFIDPVQLPK